MCGTHDPLAIRRDVHEHLVEVHVLLVVGPDQIMEGVAGDRQDMLPVELRVIQPIEQMQAARSGGRHAHAQTPRELGVPAGRKRRGLLMTNLHQSDPVLSGPQRLKKAVDAVSREGEDRIHAPVDQSLYQHVCDGICHCHALRQSRFRHSLVSLYRLSRGEIPFKRRAALIAMYE